MKISFTTLFHKIPLAIIIIIHLIFTSESFATNSSVIDSEEVNNESETSINKTHDFTYDKAIGDNYVLIWADEFDTDGMVNSANWHHQTQLIAGDSWANGELQHYTDRLDNSFIADGNLHITARRESFADQGVTKQFTSARLNSKVAFTYGRVDVRAKLPQGNGTWPAIWTLGRNINETGGYWNEDFGQVNWPACGEIDVMEHWGNNPNVIHGSLHTSSSSGATINTKKITGDDVSNSFHVYSMIWDEDQIQFLLDDVPFYTYNPAEKNASTWPFDKPQYLLLNIAMGGIGGAIDAGFSQSTMEIDYVRVYQIDESSTGDQPVSAAPIPTDNQNNVHSIFSDSYSNISGVDYSPDDGQATITSQVDIAGNNTLKYEDLNFQVTDFSTNTQDLSGLYSLHIDYWTCNSTDLNIYLISSGPNESSYTLPITLSEWVSVDIPLTEFPDPVDLTDIIQLKFEGDGTIYIDNIYFYNEVLLESQTITFEAIGDKSLEGDPFTLSATSNSGLDVSFSSTSNKVLLKEGAVTLLNAGRVTINANQEGNSNFESAPTVSQDFCISPIKGEMTVSDENSPLVTLTSNSNIGNQWFLNGDPIANAVGPSINVEIEGIYNVQITVDGCMGEISDDYSLVVTGTDLSEKIDVSVSPNPAVDDIQILGFTGDLMHIDLLDLSGKSQKIIFKKTGEATIEASIQNLSSGLYLLKIKGFQRNEVVRIIKN